MQDFLACTPTPDICAAVLLLLLLLPLLVHCCCNWTACCCLQAVCAIATPFLIEWALRVWPKTKTYVLMLLLSLVLAAAGCYILVPRHATAEHSVVPDVDAGKGVGGNAGGEAIAHVIIMGALFGAAGAGMEVLVYKHVTDLMAISGGQMAVDVGAMAYASLYNVGNLVGGTVGGALAHTSFIGQVAAVAGVSGVCCVQALALMIHRAFVAPDSVHPTPAPAGSMV